MRKYVQLFFIPLLCTLLLCVKKKTDFFENTKVTKSTKE